MRIESATVPQTSAASKNDDSHAPRANAKAHGVVRKLGADHYNPTAEARLMAHFGHLLPTEPDTEIDPVTDPIDETADSLTDPPTDDNATPSDPTIDLLA
jgi:hypothetical protein